MTSRSNPKSTAKCSPKRNVVPMHIVEPKANPDLVEVLTKLMERVLAGECIGIVVVAHTRDDEFIYAGAGSTVANRYIGHYAIDALKDVFEERCC